jgi:predicted dehydrogenase
MNSRMSISRRQFIEGSLAAATSYMVGGSNRLVAQQASRVSKSPKEHLRVAVIGAGGRGEENLKELRSVGVNIVALCDCDERRAAASFKNFPNARRYSDWRKLLDAERDVEAVLVATPDHNHAIISIAAMKLGKHVYCEKPLAHSIWEARRMAEVAAEKGVVTQMGTQGHAFEGTRRAVEVLRSGAIGEVRELHVWTDRPNKWWPQGIERPKGQPPVPQGLDWDVWLGPAPHRPFHPAYVPFQWRGFWDFGTGAIGDMGVHNLDTAFWGLELTAPTSVKIKDCSPALTETSAKETLPRWTILELQFPARGDKTPVAMTWYDGGKLPPQELFHGEPVPNKDGGSLLVGSKGSLLTRTWSGGESKDDMFVLLPRRQFEGYEPPTPSIARVRSHHHEWVAACGGEGKTLSNFGYAASLTEALLVGNLALRVGKNIEWDSVHMLAPRCSEADQFIRPQFRAGWAL